MNQTVAMVVGGIVAILVLGALVLVVLGMFVFWAAPVGPMPIAPPPVPVPIATASRILDAPLTLDAIAKLSDREDRGEAEIPALLACFEQNDEELRAQAALALAAVGAKSVPPLRGRLAERNPGVRFWAVQTLALLGPDAQPALDELLHIVQHDNDAAVRYKAVYTLGRLGLKSDRLHVAVIGALSDQDADVRSTAVEALAGMGTLPPAAAPALAKLTDKKIDRETRLRVLPMLAKTGAAATPVFRDLLKDARAHPAAANDFTAQADFTALLNAAALLGPEAKELLPELTPLLANSMTSNAQLDQALVELLKKCGPDGAMTMADALTAAQKELIVHNNRLLLLKGIGELGPEAKVAVPALVDLLKNQTASKFPLDYRQAILETLGDIGVTAREAIPTVEALQNDPVAGESARTALRRMGVIAKK